MNTARRLLPWLALAIAITGVCVWAVYVKSLETTPKPNEINTITPRVTTTEKAKPARIAEPTTTPAPNYHGTQVALDASIATHQAGIDEAMRKATGTAEALAIAHQATVYSVDVSIVQTRLSGAIADYEYGNLLHDIVISKTVVMAQDEINFAAWRQRVGNNIWLTWNIALLVLAGAAVLVVGYAVIKHYADVGKAERNATIQERQNKLDADKMKLEAERAAEIKAAKVARLHRFVVDAIKVNGEEDHQIPSNTKMEGWYADDWSGPVNDLKADMMVITNNQGTFLKVGNLGDLLHALENDDYPYPTTVASRHVAGYQSRMRDV